MGAATYVTVPNRLTAWTAVACGAVILILFGSRSWHFDRGPSIFATKQQERNANEIYHRQQTHEYRVLDNALPPQQWQQETAVQFDAGIDLNATTHRPRLIWDIFGYNCSRNIVIRESSLVRIYHLPAAGHITTAPLKSGLARPALTMTAENGYAQLRIF